jgi:putative acetyltransferase
VVGFASLVGDDLAALFVEPGSQCEGIGAALLEHVKAIRARLSLSVYVENDRAAAFYGRHGFERIAEKIEPETGRPETVMVWEGNAG